MIKRLIYSTILVALGALGTLAIPATGHTPCDQPIERCRYVQVVNPYTGKLETQYVCK